MAVCKGAPRETLLPNSARGRPNLSRSTRRVPLDVGIKHLVLSNFRGVGRPDFSIDNRISVKG